MTRWAALKWIACCLMFRFYSVLPMRAQAWLFNEVTGPFFFYLNAGLDTRPELKSYIISNNIQIGMPNVWKGRQ